MLTEYEKNLADYWANWKPGMGIYRGEIIKEGPEILEVRNVVNVDSSALIDDLVDTLKDII